MPGYVILYFSRKFLNQTWFTYQMEPAEELIYGISLFWQDSRATVNRHVREELPTHLNDVVNRFTALSTEVHQISSQLEVDDLTRQMQNLTLG